MAYRELPLPSPHPKLRIDGVAYDVDYFGMDDGQSEEPLDALRFLFQLGLGYMIHLYVIQAGARGTPNVFFHTTWIKDCVVAEIEMEDTGAPSTVETPPMDLPLLYDAVVLGARTFRIVSQTFRAGAAELVMEFALVGGTLRWTRERRWELEEAGSALALSNEEWPRFLPMRS